MDRSIFTKLLCGILVVSSCTQAFALPLAFDKPGFDKSGFDRSSISGELALLELDASEMAQTEGALAPILAFAIIGGAMSGAVASAVKQFRETGEVEPGKVVFGALVGAGLAAINAGAALTKNIVVMTTALGIDLAATAALAFAEDPTLADDGVLYRWEPGSVNANGVSYSQMQSWPYQLTASGEVSGFQGSAIPVPQPLVVDNSVQIPFDSISDPYGAGEDHYRYF